MDATKLVKSLISALPTEGSRNAAFTAARRMKSLLLPSRNLSPQAPDQAVAARAEPAFAIVKPVKSILTDPYFAGLLRELEAAVAANDKHSIPDLLAALPLDVFALLLLEKPDAFPHLKSYFPAMPSEEQQAQWVGSSGLSLLAQSVQFTRSLVALQARHGKKPLREAKVLDYGCGWGRLLRLMQKYVPEQNLHGVDAWEHSLTEARQLRVRANLQRIAELPESLPGPRFDLVYAFSVFTHLSQRAHLQALRAIRNSLADDGLVIATIRPVEYWSFANHPAAKALAESHDLRGFAFAPDSQVAHQGDDPPYGDASIALEYIETNWDGFRVAEIEYNLIDPYQIIVALKKGAAEPKEFASAEPSEAFADLDDDGFRDVLIRSEWKPVQRRTRLPGFPPRDLQNQFVGSSGEATLREADRFYRVLKTACAKAGRPLERESRVLDFGCGWGRILRFFLREVASQNLYGVDVDPDVIAVCKSLFSHGQFETVPAQAPTQLPSESFDVIYAYSVFSHLNEEISLQWFKEFARLLKPGGLLLATTQGRSFIDFCEEQRRKPVRENGWFEALARSFTDREQVLRDYDEGKFLHAPTGGGDFRPSSFYGETMIPPRYVERAYTPFLELVDFRDDRALLPQALITMRKR